MEFWWNTADFLEGMDLEVEESSIFSHVMQVIDQLGAILASESIVEHDVQGNSSDDHIDDEGTDYRSEESDRDLVASNNLMIGDKVILKDQSQLSTTPHWSLTSKTGLGEATTETASERAGCYQGGVAGHKAEPLRHSQSLAPRTGRGLHSGSLDKARATSFQKNSSKRPPDQQTQPSYSGQKPGPIKRIDRVTDPDTKQGPVSASLKQEVTSSMERSPKETKQGTGVCTGQQSGKKSGARSFTKPIESCGEDEEDEGEGGEEEGVNGDGGCQSPGRGCQPVSKYRTVSYRKIRRGNTKQRVDEFESMLNT
ncbi:hypothetical protein UPYG_G00021600 [Umbra pygmaea]|uniref:Ermin n=1 Tax=Umbra pygmaea TaxID=75934 RepID=A0ABD0XKW7_UMBPY